jgi:DNA-binding transcriptional ArsR family regulator
MIADVDIAAVGAALADQSRAAMLLALLGGEAITAGELARIAGRSPSGASGHLRALRDAGLVVAEDAGRNRFFRLAGPEIADALEMLARVAPRRAPRTLRQSEAARAIKRARTCYDHLAGELGVAVSEALLERRLLRRYDDSFGVTAAGRAWFGELGIELAAVERQRRSFARACIDWTERRPHLAGALGAALAEVFFARGWVRRLPGGRAVALTPGGRKWLAREFGLVASRSE